MDTKWILDQLRSQQITRISLDLYQIVFLFETMSLSVESRWVLKSNENVIDQHMPIEERQSFDLWRLVGQHVQSAEIETLEFSSLILTIGNTYQFIAYGDSDGFEDWELMGTTPARELFGVLCNGTI